MKIAVVGAGAVGARTARQLASTAGVERVVVSDVVDERAHTVVSSLGTDAATVAPPDDVDAAVLTSPGEGHAAVARSLVDRGVHVVSVADGVDEVRDLLALDEPARAKGV